MHHGMKLITENHYVSSYLEFAYPSLGVFGLIPFKEILQSNVSRNFHSGEDFMLVFALFQIYPTFGCK